MLIERINRLHVGVILAGHAGPNLQHIVVTAARQIFAVRRPFEATNFLGVSVDRGYAMLALSYVMVHNLTVSTIEYININMKYEIIGSHHLKSLDQDLQPLVKMCEFQERDPTLAE